MKQVITTLLVLVAANCFAQLHVSPTTTDNTFVYVSDTFLYVENEIDLEENTTGGSTEIPNIALRNGAQLLQGNGSNPDNSGSGDISVFQEGTHFATEFNFWHSPVGISNNVSGIVAAGNSVFTLAGPVPPLFVPVDELGSNPALIMPPPALDGFTSTATGTQIASFWIFGLDGGGTTAEFDPIKNTGSLAAGYGFTMKGVNGSDNTIVNGVENNPGGAQRYDFRGRPNNGEITVNIGIGDNVLTGNPYPSALDLSHFLFENSLDTTMKFIDDSGNPILIVGRGVLTGQAFFWDQNFVGSHFIEEYQGGYGVFTPIGLDTPGIYEPPTFDMFDEDGNTITTGGTTSTFDLQRRFSPVAQGFIVQSQTDLAAPSTFIIKNDHRVFAREDAASFSEFRNAETSKGDKSDPKGDSESNAVVDRNPDIVGVKINYKSENLRPIPRMRIFTEIDNTYIRPISVALYPEATRGIDFLMDAHAFGTLTADVNFVIEEQEGFAINVIDSQKDAILPLHVETEFQSSFVFYVKGFENGFDQDEVYLFDAQTGQYIDIINDKAEFILDTGIYNDRFFITFAKNATRSGEEITQEDKEEVQERLQVFNAINARQNNNAQTLEVINPEGADLINIELFDIGGKLIFGRQNVGSDTSYTFPTNNLATGVYIIRMQTQDGLTKSRKVAIDN